MFFEYSNKLFLTQIKRKMKNFRHCLVLIVRLQNPYVRTFAFHLFISYCCLSVPPSGCWSHSRWVASSPSEKNKQQILRQQNLMIFFLFFIFFVYLIPSKHEIQILECISLFFFFETKQHNIFRVFNLFKKCSTSKCVSINNKA